MAPAPFTAWQTILDPLLTPGQRNYWKSHDFTDLGDAANETWTYTFAIDAAGTWKVEFLLFRDGDFAAAYRSLHLFVTVPRP